jgi:hypothetical protein
MLKHTQAKRENSQAQGFATIFTLWWEENPQQIVQRLVLDAKKIQSWTGKSALSTLGVVIFNINTQALELWVNGGESFKHVRVIPLTSFRPFVTNLFKFKVSFRPNQHVHRPSPFVKLDHHSDPYKGPSCATPIWCVTPVWWVLPLVQRAWQLLEAEGVSGVTACWGGLYFETRNCGRWGFFYARPPFRGSSPFIIQYASWDRRGVQELDDVPWWFASLDGSFVFLDMGPSFFVLCIPTLFGCFDLFMIGRLSSLFLYMSGRAHHHTGQQSMHSSEWFKYTLVDFCEDFRDL